MRTQVCVGCIAAMLTTSPLIAQEWDLIGNVINATDWFGADVGSSAPLSFETRVNRQMLWSTDNTLRMQLNPSLPGQMIGIFGGLDLSGYLGVGDFAGVYPWASAKLHLENNPTIAVGYRPAMGDGLLSTQGEALFYSGLLGNGESGIIWSWATGPSGAPRSFRFIYTGDNQTTTTAGGVDGLELARIEPASSLNEGYFGIGDWTTAGATPDERLDILDRTIMIRRLIPDYQDNSLDQVVVADANGRLCWRDAGTLGGGDCDWHVNTSLKRITTGWTGGGSCNDQDWRVAIGTSVPTAKLTLYDGRTLGGTAMRVENDGAVSGATEIGLDLTCTNGTTTNKGLQVTANLTSALSGANVQQAIWASANTNTEMDVNHAGYFRALVQAAGSAAQNYGIEASATVNAGLIVPVNRGVKATAFRGVDNVGVAGVAEAGPDTDINYGVYGKANTNGYSPTQNWGGYFEGNARVTGMLQVNTTWYTSDESFKDNIADLDNALSIIQQVQPRTYTFAPGAPAGLLLPQGAQMGLVAQELELVIPELVTEMVHPAEYDSLGMLVTPPTPFKAVNYVGFVPLLLAAVQEQQAQIQQLQQDLASCCTLDDTGLDMRSGEYDGFTTATSLENDRLTIAPNPFQERTTLSYLLEAPARVRLQVHTESGMHLATLRDQPQEPGSYSMTWDTQDLAPGLYYVTLFTDGKPVVKKAVKVR